ncbi:hypothetical protein V6N11_037555 [Hibiscus sabdariffa]|uniref:Uncharacterized protein n=1 Tax=Hibiscus sabdariffa TaxID=183260 RepID=A0ABR2P1V9_9ROSI
MHGMLVKNSRVLGNLKGVVKLTSKSIVDTLAKHWTTTRGAEIVANQAQLMDKQQKHNKYLQFLALSKCHEDRV